MSKTFLRDYALNDRVETFAAVRKLDLREYNGKPYLVVEFGDRSGRLNGIFWNDPEEVVKSVSTGDVVKLMGRVGTYKDNLQIRMDAVRVAQEGEYDRNDIFPGPSRPLPELLAQFDSLMDGIEDPNLSELLKKLVGRDGLYREPFMQAPGGKLWHHNYRGGLLEHTLSVASICKDTGPRYPFIKVDLLLTGALLHDLGKVVEYDYRTDVIDFSDEGRLQGHIVIGHRMISDVIREIDGFPAELERGVSHLILAHQGNREYGSPVVPQTGEALLLYYADEMDSKAAAFGRILGETARSGKTWSHFVPLMDRYLYAGNLPESFVDLKQSS